mmetsp:Transcript_33283/g.108844  ORF Transcript_33283/g.108844 Transcript_33283/m.108844 type:complete len:460 (-) Transcript_33283:383-1762(-)
MAATRGGAPEWRFFQVFGEEQPDGAGVEDIQEADLLSALDFDETGNYLATGDRGGRIVVFERATPDEQQLTPDDQRPCPAAALRAKEKAQYRFLTEFQSHEPEFDFLKSLEIEEKINSMRWCKGTMGCKMLLSTNDKTIKLWKVYGKKIKTVSNMNIEPRNGCAGGPAAVMRGRGLRLPLMATCERVVTATPKRTFANAHAYHINSVALCSDGESFLSCDDLRLNLWNLRDAKCCFNIVDVKPANMEALSKVLTSADFHPIDCHTFLYSSSRGCVRLGDMRAAALCDASAKSFEEPEDPATKSFFSEITSSIASARFSRDGRNIVTRDYLSVRIWDVRVETRPIKTIAMHEHLRPKLCDLYEKDCIFDKFECCFNHNATHVLTGSYQNRFHLLSADGSTPDLALEASQTPYRRASAPPLYSAADLPPDFSRRVLHTAFHPQHNVAAIAATSTLYIMNGT